MDPFTFIVNQDGGAVFMARITGWEGALVDQATFAGGEAVISRVVVDKTAGSEDEDIELDPTVVIFDEAQVADNWPFTDGYNFRDELPPDAFDTADHEYILQYEFTPNEGEDKKFVSAPVLVLIRNSARSYATEE